MYKGIDVSYYNGELDWELIKNDGIEFAIIRLGYGSDYQNQDDRQAIRNLKECERLNIPYGGYIYSYALKKEDAISEAQHALRVIKDFHPRLGIFIDMEDADGYKKKNGLIPEKNGDILTDFCLIFMNKIREHGYNTGVYANKNYFDNVLKTERFEDYTKWLAIWGPQTPPEGDWTIWQYTSDGKVNGSSERTDMNYYLKEFPKPNPPESGQNSENTSEEDDISTEENNESLKYKQGDIVNYHEIYSDSQSDRALNPLYESGRIMQVFNGKRNPYLVENQGIAIGFLNDNSITGLHKEGADIEKQPGAQPEDIYIVKTGDTLSQIAAGYNMNYLEIANYNNIKDANKIYPGQIIKINRKIKENFSVGDSVRIKQNATDMNTNGRYASYVYNSVYEIMTISGNYVVFGRNGQVKGKTDKSNILPA